MAVPAVAVAHKINILRRVAAHVQQTGFLAPVQDIFSLLFGYSPSAQTLDEMFGEFSEPHADFERHSVDVFPPQPGGLPAITCSHPDGIILLDIGHDLMISVNDIPG